MKPDHSNPQDAPTQPPGSSFILHPSSFPWPWLSLAARVLVGGTFLVAATMKLIAPVENFEAAIHSFGLAPAPLEHPLALALPWIELFAGAFCLLGLFTRASAWVMAVMLAAFIAALAWARANGIALDNCGCFGRWDFVQSPGLLLLRDAILLLLTLPLLGKQRHRFALEEYAGRAT